VEQDGTLIEDCLKSRVIVATPTTLIALLKAIEFGWRQEEISHNAEEIRKHGKDLYDRIVTLAAHFERLGNALATTVTQYNNAVGSLETRVVVTARKISELERARTRSCPMSSRWMWCRGS
jgi:DNA recombination protein RmuC